MSLHIPDSAFRCVVCGNPWPCATRRSELAAEAETVPTATRLYLAATAHDARRALGLSDREAYDRFLAFLDQTAPRRTHEPGEWRFP